MPIAQGVRVKGMPRVQKWASYYYVGVARVGPDKIAARSCTV